MQIFVELRKMYHYDILSTTDNVNATLLEACITKC